MLGVAAMAVKDTSASDTSSMRHDMATPNSKASNANAAKPNDLVRPTKLMTNRVSKLLVPEPLPPPQTGTKNPLGRQVHQVEIRSGGVIAFRVPLWQKMLVGASAGVLGTTAVFPIDLVKTRLQLSTFQSNVGVSSIVRDVFARYGARGFYRGLPPTAVFVAPEKAIKLG